MTDLTVLTKPFAEIATRKGPRGTTLPYVKGKHIIARLLEASEGAYDWQVIEIRYAPGQPRANAETGEAYTTPGVYIVHGRLTIPDFGTKDGVGTAVEENEEAAKAAETDALKRAAKKFGIALEVEGEDGDAQQQRPAGNGTGAARPAIQAGKLSARLNTTGNLCPSCHCPAGKPHTANCTTTA